MIYAFVTKNEFPFIAAFDTEIQDYVSDILECMGIGCRDWTVLTELDAKTRNEYPDVPVIQISPALSFVRVEYAFQCDRERQQQFMPEVI